MKNMNKTITTLILLSCAFVFVNAYSEGKYFRSDPDSIALGDEGVVTVVFNPAVTIVNKMNAADTGPASVSPIDAVGRSVTKNPDLNKRWFEFKNATFIPMDSKEVPGPASNEGCNAIFERNDKKLNLRVEDMVMDHHDDQKNYLGVAFRVINPDGSNGALCFARSVLN